MLSFSSNALSKSTPPFSEAFEPTKKDNNLTPYLSSTQEVHTDKFLSKRYIAHLFGDSFIDDTVHEGWSITDALLHMVQVLEENEVSSEVKAVKEDLKKCLEFQGLFMSKFINGVSEEDENFDAVISSHTELLLERVKNLEIGEKLVFPGGDSSHSILYDLQKVGDNNYQFNIYNTGDGSSKHWLTFQKDGSCKIQAVYRIFDVSMKKIIENDLFTKLIKLRLKSSEDFEVELYDNILPKLGGTRESMPADASAYMSAQRAGTCAWKMLCAYLRYNVSLDTYKYIKLKARLQVFEKWNELGFPLECNRVNRELLSRLFVNFSPPQFNKDCLSIELSREELLALSIIKAEKTYNRYQFLLTDAEREKAKAWHFKYTGEHIDDPKKRLIAMLN